MRIPLVDLQAQYHSIRDDVRAAVDSVLEKCQFILGGEVTKFEEEFARYIGAKHAIEPQDAGKLVAITNDIVATIKHPLAYVHMPVPIARNDDAYFKPLAGLKLAPGTQLYLGVVHAADGAEGTKKRIAAASQYVKAFGIATECGMSRQRTPELVEKLLEIHAEVAVPAPL